MLPPTGTQKKGSYCPSRKFNWKETVLHTNMFTPRRLIKYYEMIPLFCLVAWDIAFVSFMSYNALFRSTIDVQFSNKYQRFEMPTVSRFFNLREPRNLKLFKTHEWKPAIHLDNRYRLMRGEQMLDAQGNPTDQIGEDETAGEPFDIELPD